MSQEESPLAKLQREIRERRRRERRGNQRGERRIAEEKGDDQPSQAGRHTGRACQQGFTAGQGSGARPGSACRTGDAPGAAG